MKLARLITALALAGILGGCGDGGDSSAATETTISQGKSEVSEVIAIKRRGDDLHDRFVEDRKLQKTCLRLMKGAGRAAGDAWFEAVEEEAPRLTSEQRQAMSNYEGAIECVRDTEADIKRFGEEIEKLTKRLDAFSPSVIEKAMSRLSS